LAIGNSKKNRKREDSVGQFSNAHCKCPVLPGSRVVVWQEIKKNISTRHHVIQMKKRE
jgi:hypothetical protein